jgi:hypothetical protein
MKLFLDTKARRFVKSAASNVALQTLHLKRRDQVPIEIVFVANNAVTTPPTGTATTVGLKSKFSDPNFLALAAPGTAILDLNTTAVEAAFAANPAAIPALLEVRWSAPGESLRTATLQVELQNSVILGTEGTPTAIPDLKATQAQAEAGTDNERWMTPLRTAQAIAVLAPPPTWDSILEKPEEFPPEAHEHTAADITDFAAAVQAVSPAEHTHEISEVTGLSAALAAATSAAVTQVGGDLALKADLVNGTVPASQLPPISYQTTRHDGDGTLTAFAPPGTLTASDSPSAISVAINGVTQEPVADYTLDIPANRVVLSGPLPLGDKIVITRPILLPSNSTLTAEQLGAATTQALAVESAARTQADAALQSALGGKQASGTYATLVNGKVPADQLPAANSAVTSVAGKTGAVTLVPSDVGAQPLLTPQGTVTPSNTAIISLTANRAILFTKTQPGDFQLQLPQTATAGDRIVVVRNAGTNDGLLHIQRFNSGGWQTLSTLTANGQRASFYRDSTNWSLESAPPHTHAVADITGAASTSALAALEARVAALEAANP